MGGMSEEGQLYRVRAVDSDDSLILEQLDVAYSGRLGIEPTAVAGSASFHARTGHSFIAELAGQPQGFVLASAIWTGGRPLVRMERLVTAAAGDQPALLALLAALVKSAYDAGVYDLLAEVPAADSAGRAALAGSSFSPADAVLYGRTLGSRGQQKDGS